MSTGKGAFRPHCVLGSSGNAGGGVRPGAWTSPVRYRRTGRSGLTAKLPLGHFEVQTESRRIPLRPRVAACLIPTHGRAREVTSLRRPKAIASVREAGQGGVLDVAVGPGRCGEAAGAREAVAGFGGGAV